MGFILGRVSCPDARGTGTAATAPVRRRVPAPRRGAREAKELLQRCQRRQADARRLDEIVTKDLDQRPQDLDLHHELGAIPLRTGAEEDGLWWLHNLLRQDPRHRDTHRLLAGYYERAGNLELAAYHRRLSEQ